MPSKKTEMVPLTDPFAILGRMVERGVGLEQMEKMIAMIENLAAMKAEAAYNLDMSICQSEMTSVPFDSRNQRTGKDYSSFAALMGMVQPIYTRHGFSLRFREDEKADPASQRTRIWCDICHRDGHKESISGLFTADGTGAKGGETMNAIQGECSRFTYACKRLVTNAFALRTGDDADGEEAWESLIEAEQQELIALIGDKQPNMERFWAWVNEMHKNPEEKIGTVAAIGRRHFTVIRDMLQKAKGGGK